MAIDTLLLLNDSIHILHPLKADSVFLLNNFSQPDSVIVAKDLSKGWWTKNQAWISLVTTILTFILGYVLAFMIEKKKKKKHLIQVQDYVLLWIRKNRRVIKQQLEELWRQANFKDMDETLLKYQKSDISLNKITGLETVELAEVFVYGRKESNGDRNLNTMYYDLMHNIEFFISVDELAAEYFLNKFQVNFLNYTNQASRLSKKFYDKCDKFTLHFQGMYRNEYGNDLLQTTATAFDSFGEFLKKHIKDYNDKFDKPTRSKVSNLRNVFLPEIIKQLGIIYQHKQLRYLPAIEELTSMLDEINLTFQNIQNTINIHRRFQYSNYLKMNCAFKMFFKTIHQYKKEIKFKKWYQL
jgi:hypothetical protein